MSWQATQIFFLSLVVVSFTIATIFAWKGLWLILPFAGFEMLILGLALYFCQSKLRRSEVITIGRETISVSFYEKKEEVQYTMNRYWTKAVLVPARLRGYPNKLCLFSQGKELEIGRMLKDEEKSSLANALNHTITDDSYE